MKYAFVSTLFVAASVLANHLPQILKGQKFHKEAFDNDCFVRYDHGKALHQRGDACKRASTDQTISNENGLLVKRAGSDDYSESDISEYEPLRVFATEVFVNGHQVAHAAQTPPPADYEPLPIDYGVQMPSNEVGNTAWKGLTEAALSQEKRDENNRRRRERRSVAQTTREEKDEVNLKAKESYARRRAAETPAASDERKRVRRDKKAERDAALNQEERDEINRRRREGSGSSAQATREVKDERNRRAKERYAKKRAEETPAQTDERKRVRREKSTKDK